MNKEAAPARSGTVADLAFRIYRMSDCVDLAKYFFYLIIIH